MTARKQDGHGRLEIVHMESISCDHGDIHTKPIDPPIVCDIDDVPDVVDYRLHMPLNIIHARRELAHTRIKIKHVDQYLIKYRYHWLAKLVEMKDVFLCRHFHGDIKWDGSSHYECIKCHKKYAVPWADKNKLDHDVYFWEE